jgi:hypothetical protein
MEADDGAGGLVVIKKHPGRGNQINQVEQNKSNQMGANPLVLERNRF